MRRVWLCCLAVAMATAAGAAPENAPPDSGPSLEYRPPRTTVPEPKAPMPAPPVSIFKESFGGFGIGTGSFDTPVDVALDADGNIYVLDAGNSRVQMFDRFRRFVVAWGSAGSRVGEFSRPETIAVGPGGEIYVVDTGNHRIQQFGWVPKGACSDCPARPDGQRIKLLNSWGSLGSRGGNFNRPRDIAFEGDEIIWVLDAGNDRLQRFQVDRSAGKPPLFKGEIGPTSRSRAVFEGVVSISWSDEQFGFLYLLGKNCVMQKIKTDGTLIETWPAVAPESGACVPSRVRADNQLRYLYTLDSGNGILSRFHREGRFLSALRGAEQPFSRPGGFALNVSGDQFVVADTGNNVVQQYTLR